MAPLPLYPERRAFAPSPLCSVPCRPEFMLILLGTLYLYCILLYSLCSLSCISVFSLSANIKFFLSSHPSPFQTFNGYDFPSSSPSPLSLLRRLGQERGQSILIQDVAFGYLEG